MEISTELEVEPSAFTLSSVFLTEKGKKKSSLLFAFFSRTPIAVLLRLEALYLAAVYVPRQCYRELRIFAFFFLFFLKEIERNTFDYRRCCVAEFFVACFSLTTTAGVHKFRSEASWTVATSICTCKCKCTNRREIRVLSQFGLSKTPKVICNAFRNKERAVICHFSIIQLKQSTANSPLETRARVRPVEEIGSSMHSRLFTL